MTDYERLDQLGKTLAEDIVARRISPIEGAHLIWQRVCNEDWPLMHEYTVFAGLASEWEDSRKSKGGEEYRAHLVQQISEEARRIVSPERRRSH